MRAWGRRGRGAHTNLSLLVLLASRILFELRYPGLEKPACVARVCQLPLLPLLSRRWWRYVGPVGDRAVGEPIDVARHRRRIDGLREGGEVSREPTELLWDVLIELWWNFESANIKRVC